MIVDVVVPRNLDGTRGPLLNWPKDWPLPGTGQEVRLSDGPDGNLMQSWFVHHVRYCLQAHGAPYVEIVLSTHP